jgi:hypothetical protein
MVSGELTNENNPSIIHVEYPECKPINFTINWLETTPDIHFIEYQYIYYSVGRAIEELKLMPISYNFNLDVSKLLYIYDKLPEGIIGTETGIISGTVLSIPDETNSFITNITIKYPGVDDKIMSIIWQNNDIESDIESDTEFDTEFD